MRSLLAKTRPQLKTCCLAVSLFQITSLAHAEETSAARRAAAAKEKDRPYMLAEIGLGLNALPGADVCPVSLDNCHQGETSVAFSLHHLYRYHFVGIGAGIEWAKTLRNEAARGYESLGRDHSRSYFQVDAQFRYYFVKFDTWELFAGASIGGVVVNDSWSVEEDRDPYSDTAFVGPRAATIGTEGLSAGFALGAEWSFAKNWTFGSRIGYASWYFPQSPEQSPTLDFASLHGRLDMFDLSLALGYRIAL